MANFLPPVHTLYALLRAPEGLRMALGGQFVRCALETGGFPVVLDTLQVLADQLQDHYLDVTELRALIFNLTLLREGDSRGQLAALQKIADQLQSIPPEIFQAAAEYVAQSRVIRFAPSEEVRTLFEEVLALKAREIISQARVPILLRLAAAAGSEDRVKNWKAVQSLKLIEARLKEAYSQATTLKVKQSLLQQYSYFVILTSGLIPPTAPVDLEFLPKVVIGNFTGNSQDNFSRVNQESFRTVQALEALRDLHTEPAFVEQVGRNLFQFVVSANLHYPAGSDAALRSRWIKNHFDSLPQIVFPTYGRASEWLDHFLAVKK